MLHSFILCNFLVRMLKYFEKKLEMFFCPPKVEKTTSKSCILMEVGRFFFLCSHDCPKQPRTSFPFYNLFYITVSCRIYAMWWQRLEINSQFFRFMLNSIVFRLSLSLVAHNPLSFWSHQLYLSCKMSKLQHWHFNIRPFNLHLDFWKLRSWKIKVCFKP